MFEYHALASRFKELFEDIACSACITRARNGRAMVTGWLLEKARTVQHRTALGIVGGKNQPRHPCHGDGAHTHGAGLQRHIQRDADQALISQFGSSLTQDQNFGMSGGVLQLDNPVAALGQKAAIGRRQYGADRYLTASGGALRLTQCQCYGLFVIHPQDPF